MISAHAIPVDRRVAPMQFVIFGSSFLLKVLIFDLAYVIYLIAADFGTDLFVDDIQPFRFLVVVLIVNVVCYAFLRGFTVPAALVHDPIRVGDGLNDIVIALLITGFVATYFALGQKTLSLSSSTALVAIAANSRAVAFVALAVFGAGVPEAIAQDEYIPIIFCALINGFVFLPWLMGRGRHIFLALSLAALACVGALAFYYVQFRYSPFKLVERIFEQAAPISWQGDAWLWFHPFGIIGGMPDERLTMVMDGAWDAQFKVTYLIVNAPVLGSAFLLAFAYLLGRLCARTLADCRRPGSNVFKNFLKLKLILILIEVMGEKVSDIEKIVTYSVLIVLVSAFEMLWLHAARSGLAPTR